ncbi:MAG: hypothetical protein IKS12_02560, partial [Eubacterium sp.]|nr:hypothetical protein [Eubacterium sp.]
LTIYNASRDASCDFEIPYNGKVEIDPEAIVETGTKVKTVPGKLTICGEEDSLVKGVGVNRGGELYKMTIVEGISFETWSALRGEYDPAAKRTEVPFDANEDGEFKFFADSAATIVLYEDEDGYNEALETNEFIVNAPRTTVRDRFVLSNNKFTMNGKLYLPDGNSLVECGILMYIGNQEIAADDLTLTTYKNLPGAYRLKYTKSTEYGNINVSFLRKAADGTPYFSGATRVRYRTFLTYKDSSDAIHTVYSNLADDTQNM